METRKGRPDDTSDYSASQAPETQESAQNPPTTDERAIPGGSRERSTASVGMESLTKEEPVSSDPGLTDQGKRQKQ